MILSRRHLVPLQTVQPPAAEVIDPCQVQLKFLGERT